jgi:hypothetical protein
MRFTFVILLFCCLGADAQMIIKAHANYVPFASANLLLDQYSGAAAAYSLRKLRTAYTGNCIRIRRLNDNAEQNIGFDASGVIDTNAIKNFAGNNRADVVTWYDQSGNGINMTQSTALNQPIIKNDITEGNLIVRRNSKPSIFFGSNENDRLLSSRILSNDDFSIFGAVGLNLVQTNNAILAQHAGTADLGRTSFLATGAGADNDNGYIFFNNGTSYSAVTTNTYTIATPPILSLFESESDNLGTTTIKINGAGTGTISGQTWTPLNTNTTIGAFGNGNNAITGGVSEIIIYSTKQSNASGIRNNINSYYGIY